MGNAQGIELLRGGLVDTEAVEVLPVAGDEIDTGDDVAQPLRSVSECNLGDIRRAQS